MRRCCGSPGAEAAAASLKRCVPSMGRSADPGPAPASYPRPGQPAWPAVPRPHARRCMARARFAAFLPDRPGGRSCLPRNRRDRFQRDLAGGPRAGRRPEWQGRLRRRALCAVRAGGGQHRDGDRRGLAWVVATPRRRRRPAARLRAAGGAARCAERRKGRRGPCSRARAGRCFGPTGYLTGTLIPTCSGRGALCTRAVPRIWQRREPCVAARGLQHACVEADARLQCGRWRLGPIARATRSAGASR